jgi:uncharacterized protein (DUF58 family)
MPSPPWLHGDAERPPMKRAASTALAGTALTLVALLFGTAPMFVPGIAFTALGLTVPAWVWLSARRATVQRLMNVERAVEDEPVHATIEVRRGRLGLPGGEITDPIAGVRPVGARLSIIDGHRTARIRAVASFPRRGIHRLAPPTLLVQDSLALARVLRAGGSPPQELLVLPRTERVSWAGGGAGPRPDASAAAAARDPHAAVDLDGLRPYRPGTPASRIHWSALARGAGLLERRLQADGESFPVVILDSRGDGPPEQLDAAVRAAASLTLEFARAGGCALLLPGERRTITVARNLASWPAVPARLAVVEGGDSTRAPILRTGAYLRQVFYVAARPIARVPPALSGISRGVTVLVLPKELGVPAAARRSLEVTGCVGFILAAAR